MSSIPPHVSRYYAFLKAVGINMLNQHPNEINRISEAIHAPELAGFKDEWWEAMEEFVSEHDVKQPLKVITGMEAWVARGGPPSERAAKEKPPATSAEMDAEIDRWQAGQAELYPCCGRYPLCQPEWRVKLVKEMA